MTRSKARGVTAGPANNAARPSKPSADGVKVSWPRLSDSDPSVEHLLNDQIVLLRGALSRKTCQSIVSLFRHPDVTCPSTASASSTTIADKRGLQTGTAQPVVLVPSPPARKGEAHRTNARFSVDDPAFAEQLYRQSGLKHLLEEAEPERWIEKDGRRPRGLLSNIRVYCYSPQEFFQPHYDTSSQDPRTGLRTEWTVLFYLTGKEDGVLDDETVFYRGHSTVQKMGKGKKDGEEAPIVAPLERGMALLHRHGKACMLHEGRPPAKASRESKWVLRSDLLFGKD